VIKFRDLSKHKSIEAKIWYAVKNGVGYTFAAVAENVQADEREKFKCLVR
jgi:hypothetical protein